MAEAQQTSDIYGILLDPLEPRVLLLMSASGAWVLPHVSLPDKRLFFPMVEVVCNQMGELLAAEISVLRTVYAQYSEDRSHVDLIYILENHSDEWKLPAQARWTRRAELEELALGHADQRALVDAILQETDSGIISPLRQSWAFPGWIDEASGWMRERLTEQGYVLTAPIHQIKCWGISCLLRAHTDRGNIYFKVATSLPLFGNEPVLLKSLAERYPDYVPAPIAIEPTRHWMLMTDFGEELHETPRLERWQAAVRRFGQLQVQAIPGVEELFALGCLDRRLDVLAAQIDPLLSDHEALAPMTADEIAQIRTRGSRLKEMCRELGSYHVPYTLNHGDLHSGNITGDALLFFDWTDACIAHPFLDLSIMMMDAEDIPGGREGLLDAYLDLWLDYEPMERLREMYRLAEPLGALHQAISYQHILATQEPTSKQEFITGVPLWLRRVLQTMPD